MQNLGVFWKIQDICYIMGTEIFKIEEEMPEKMKPEVANPPSKNRQNSLLTLCTPLMVEGKVKVVLYPWPDVSSSKTIMP